MAPTLTAIAPTSYAPVQVPVAADDAVCWAKAVARVDADGSNGHALHGKWLRRGVRYELPIGVLVVTVEKYRRQRRMSLTLWRVDPDRQDGLVQVHSWQRRSIHVGPSILGYIARRITPDVPQPGDCFPIMPPQPNKRRGRCVRCDRWVAVREGLWVVEHVGSGRVEHDGECPPPAQCDACGAVAERAFGWTTLHDDKCPHRPPVRNRRGAPCAICWGWVKAGGGLLRGGYGDWRVEHDRGCPPNPMIPDGALIWHVHEIDQGGGLVYDYPTGTVVRATIPADSPQLPGVSVIGVVVAVDTGRRRDERGHWRDTLHTVWRPATLDEAAPVLDGEQNRMEDAKLLARLRTQFAMHGGAMPADATLPSRDGLDDLDLTSLPATMIPAGAKTEVMAAVDETNGVVWTVIRNLDQADWALSNFGGWTVARHPLTPERRGLLAELAGGWAT